MEATFMAECPKTQVVWQGEISISYAGSCSCSSLGICCWLLLDAELRGPLGWSDKAAFMQQLIASLVKFQVSFCLLPNLSCAGSSRSSSSDAAAKQVPAFCIPWVSLCDHLLWHRLQQRQSCSLNEMSPRRFVICITETKQYPLFKKIIK